LTGNFPVVVAGSPPVVEVGSLLGQGAPGSLQEVEGVSLLVEMVANLALEMVVKEMAEMVVALYRQDLRRPPE
jgi:hypothetical protein